MWAISPYLGLAIMSRLFRRKVDTSIVVLTGALAIGVGGVFVVYDTAFVDIHSTGGLALIALPLYQWLGVGLTAMLARLLNHRQSG